MGKPSQEADAEDAEEPDPYDVGANVMIRGGARPHLHSALAMVLPVAAGTAAF